MKLLKELTMLLEAKAGKGKRSPKDVLAAKKRIFAKIEKATGIKAPKLDDEEEDLKEAKAPKRSPKELLAIKKKVFAKIEKATGIKAPKLDDEEEDLKEDVSSVTIYAAASDWSGETVGKVIGDKHYFPLSRKESDVVDVVADYADFAGSSASFDGMKAVDIYSEIKQIRREDDDSEDLNDCAGAEISVSGTISGSKVYVMYPAAETEISKNPDKFLKKVKVFATIDELASAAGVSDAKSIKDIQAAKKDITVAERKLIS